jgi:hypothetical protein
MAALAFVPLGLEASSLSPRSLWAISSGAFLAHVTFYHVVFWRRYLAIRAQWPWRPIAGSFGLAAHATAMAAQVMNILSVAPGHEFSLFLLGLVWGVVYVGIVFSEIIFHRPSIR